MGYINRICNLESEYEKKIERQVIFVTVPLKADILKSLFNLDWLQL